MTAAVAAIPPLHELPDSSAMARKRRREILSTQRSFAPDFPVSSLIEAQDADVAPASKKRRAVKQEEEPESSLELAKPIKTVITRKAKAGVPSKKPQMKYDPDVPMTKEEAAVWRREQRRKRNRESAAASRQRQRDRIAELEVELEEAKTSFKKVMQKIHDLEEITQTSVSADLLTDLPTSSTAQGIVSPASSPSHSPRQSPTVSPVASYTFVDAGLVSSQEKQQADTVKEEKDEECSTHKISRPAESRIIT